MTCLVIWLPWISTRKETITRRKLVRSFPSLFRCLSICILDWPLSSFCGRMLIWIVPLVLLKGLKILGKCITKKAATESFTPWRNKSAKVLSESAMVSHSTSTSISHKSKTTGKQLRDKTLQKPKGTKFELAHLKTFHLLRIRRKCWGSGRDLIWSALMFHRLKISTSKEAKPT